MLTRLTQCVAVALTVATGCAGLTSAQTAPATRAESTPPETEAQRDARMKWWREARFGMFIHWGIYSVPAGVYEGKDVPGIGEWIMNRAKIPVGTYAEYAKDFNPVKFDAEQWVKIAKDAGMKYIVITAKHHDGFAMFGSKVTPFNIVDATPFKRDVLKELAEACRKHDMKLGFYYSQAQDWHHPGGAAANGHWDKAQDGDMKAYIEKIAVPQVREILTNYGDVAVLWWDTPTNMTKEMAAALLPELKAQPQIITNNRLGGGVAGDTETPEQFIPATGIAGRDWETCMTMNGTWGYKSKDTSWKSAEKLLQNLIDIASKGGNYLLNVGPTAEGEIPEASVTRLKEMGAWLKVNGEAIYATTASPFRAPPWGRVTTKQTAEGTTLYLHVFHWPANKQLLVPVKNDAGKAFLLSDPKKLLNVVTEGTEGLVVTVPAEAPDKIASVIALELKGKLEVLPQLIEPAGDGSLSLVAEEAKVDAGLAVTRAGHNRKGFVGGWSKADQAARWELRIRTAGSFDGKLQCTAPKAGSKAVVTVGETRIELDLPVSADGKSMDVKLPRIDLTEGKPVVSVVVEGPGAGDVKIHGVLLQRAKAAATQGK